MATIRFYGLLLAVSEWRVMLSDVIGAVTTDPIERDGRWTCEAELSDAQLIDAADQVAVFARVTPEHKLRLVRALQARGHIVAMTGDGVNDAPALKQADIGLAMGVAGSDVAIEAAHIALMRDDWSLVPDVIRIARRTMRTVKINIGFTIGYNFIGLSLAAFGLLPPIFAAAAQSLPDIGILANSSRLIRQK